MKIRQIFVLAVILILPSLVFSADNSREFRVKLDVRCDESIESRLEGYLSRELRALDDVIQSEENHDYVITVIGAKLTNTIGEGDGVVLSVNIHTRFNNQSFCSMFKKKYAKECITMTNDLYHYPKHWVRSGSYFDLRSMCRGIIADFDSQILHKQRDGSEKFFDLSN
jgi:hypothetical protein